MYKPELKEEIIKLISGFFQIEQGNRITPFNVDGLLLKMNPLFEKCKIVDKNGDKEGKKK